MTVAPPPRSPTVTDVAVLCGLTLGAALAVRAGGGAVVVGSWGFAVVIAATSALVLGLPALAFTLERGRATLAWMTTLGATCGVLPLLLLGASGVIGFRVRGGNWERAAWALERGMPVPAVGVIFWERFGRLELQAGLIGACCALMWWLIMVRATPATRAINVLWAGFALATLVTASTFLR